MEYDTAGQTDADHLWLEEVEGEKALATVRRWNERSAKRMQGETYQALKAELLEVFNSPEKIPYASYRDGKVGNFWQDDKHVRGVWRTTTLESYRSKNPEWETLLDIDALAKKEGKNWVYKGGKCLALDHKHCMILLSDGGKDAVVHREFDRHNKCFVKHGFITDESKGNTAWLTQDQLLIGVDFSLAANSADTKTTSLTNAGYPMINKLWQRGTPLAEARELMRGKKADMVL